MCTWLKHTHRSCWKFTRLKNARTKRKVDAEIKSVWKLRCNCRGIRNTIGENKKLFVWSRFGVRLTQNDIACSLFSALLEDAVNKCFLFCAILYNMGAKSSTQMGAFFCQLCFSARCLSIAFTLNNVRSSFRTWKFFSSNSSKFAVDYDWKSDILNLFFFEK